mmetsp:Transcript_60251/g.161674  ORF Transcript_60251/g.161674 Transcript_60251/m.161674 type:complete len:155 (+) Transcript_60251:618-1082(+)
MLTLCPWITSGSRRGAEPPWRSSCGGGGRLQRIWEASWQGTGVVGRGRSDWNYCACGDWLGCGGQCRPWCLVSGLLDQLSWAPAHDDAPKHPDELCEISYKSSIISGLVLLSYLCVFQCLAEAIVRQAEIATTGGVDDTTRSWSISDAIVRTAA